MLLALFAFSGLRFAGLPAHKALVVGPAEQGAVGRVTGSYYLVRGAIVIPSGALGGVLWAFASPELSFTVATAVGLVGVGYFALFGESSRPTGEGFLPFLNRSRGVPRRLRNFRLQRVSNRDVASRM